MCRRTDQLVRSKAHREHGCRHLGHDLDLASVSVHEEGSRARL